MTTRSVCLLLLLFWSFVQSQTQKLKFNPNGEFKILQLTDIHSEPNSINDNKNFLLFQNLINKTQPDLVILTGDIVTASPSQKGWENFCTFFSKQKLPWTIVLGNHDHEAEWTKDQIASYLKKCPYFQGYNLPVSGVLNHSLNIYSNKDTSISKAKLLLADSHDYVNNSAFGKYDWVKLDQIQWLQKEAQHSEEYHLPTLLFLHIPLPEYEAGKSLGKESIASPQVNSGLFSHLLPYKTFLGTFCGHDHDNNFEILHRGKSLVYGNVSGVEAYGSLPRGGRLITLKENELSFRTKILSGIPLQFSTTYHHPSGLKEVTDKDTLIKSISKSAHIEFKKGISYRYAEGKITSAQEIKKLKTSSIGIASTIEIPHNVSNTHFGLEFNGYLLIPETNRYRLNLRSDDGSVLYLHNKEQINNDGGHSAKTVSKELVLEKGYHPINLLYFQGTMGKELSLSIETIRGELTPELFHD
ncbi:metallophosphoesterase [Riemerella anatipestifer]|uniref:metallophosphoesterase n=1 Tax=Riemerella anatipestifer TaxID=34085 RepID=UPI003DA92BB9